MISKGSSLRRLLDQRIFAILLLGFSAGLPILLIFSSLGIWLREAGIERASVTMFSWAALGYSFKFIWAPLVDRLPLPYLTRLLGRRRSWMILSQFFIMVAIVWMGSINPAEGSGQLLPMALAAVLLGFSSATQDIVIDAYRIEIAGVEMQTLLSANYVAGYRVGMLFAGAGVLFVAQYFSSSMENYHYPAWRNAYFSAAALMLIGMATTLWVKEPQVHRDQLNGGDASAHLRFFLLFLISVATLISAYWFTPDAFLSGGKTWLASTLNNKVLASLLVESLRMAGAILMVMIVVRTIVSTELIDGKTFVASYVEPVREFVSRYRMSVVVLLLALVGLYRISDIVLGVISNVFYVDMGYSKSEIATVVKTLGLLMTILGGFLGGLLALRVGVISMLFLGAFLTIVTNLLFVLLSTAGHNLALLGAVISADNLTAGLASAAFIAFLSSLTNVKFTAVQYAIFSSMMTLIPKAFGGYSGTFVDIMGYQNFFIFTSLLGVPVLFLIWRLSNATGLEGIWQNPVSEQATRQD